MRPLVLLLTAAALLTGPPLAAQPALTGPELFVDLSNQVPYRTLCCIAAATDAGGRVMVIWLDELQPQQLRVRGRVFDASGRSLRPAFTIATGSTPPVYATLVPAVPDGFLLVWRSSERTGTLESHRLLARRLSPSGRPRGGVISIRGPLPFEIGSMQAASFSDGSFVVVWTGTVPGTGRDDVFLRRFDAAGRPLAPAALLPRDGETGERFVHSLGVLDDGEMRIAWRSRSVDGSSSALWVRRFDRNGSPLAAPVQTLPATADIGRSAITFGPDGGFLTTWKVQADDALHLRAFAPDGTPFAEQEASVSYLYEVAAERGGTFLVLDAGYSCQAGLQIEADGTPRGPVGCLTRPSSGDPVSSPAVTGTDGGGLFLFWSQTHRTGEDQDWIDQIFGQRLATASPGTLQIERAHSVLLEGASDPLTIPVTRRDGNAGTVSVEYRLTGAAVGRGTLTFPDGDSRPQVISIPVSDDETPGNDRRIRVALLRPTGGAVLGLPRRAVVEVRDEDGGSPLLARAQPPIELTYASGSSSVLVGPGLATSPDGGFAVAWGYTRRANTPYPSYDFSLQGVRFDAATFPAAAFETSCEAEAGRVRLVLRPEGGVTVFWQSGEERWTATGATDGFVQRFDARGVAAGPAVSLGFPADDVASLPQGRLVAAGRGHDAAGDGLFIHFLSARGLDQRSPLPVTRQALQPGSPAAVAADGTGRSVVAWAVAPTGEGPAGIFARRFDASGAPLGPVLRVSQWDGQDRAPGVDMDVHGNFVVAWQRSWDGSGTGIYARAFQATGAPWSGEIPVNSFTVGNQETPSVAVTDDGRFAVFWWLWASGQLFSLDGTRLGSEVDLPGDYVTPVAVWSDRGSFVVLTGSYDQLSAQRLPL